MLAQLILSNLSFPPVKVVTKLKNVKLDDFPELLKEKNWQAIRSRGFINTHAENHFSDFFMSERDV